MQSPFDEYKVILTNVPCINQFYTQFVFPLFHAEIEK